MIEEHIMSSQDSTPIFMMKDLRSMYQEKLEHLGATNDYVSRVNVTRLKQRILKQIPGLCEQKSGKFVLLTLDGEVGEAIFEASLCTSQDDGVILCKAAKIIRKHLFLQEEVFDGNLSKERQKTSVPAHLIHLVGLILEGATHYDNTSKGTEIVALNLAQLLRFSAIKHKRRDEAINRRHSKMNEPPLPV